MNLLLKVLGYQGNVILKNLWSTYLLFPLPNDLWNNFLIFRITNKNSLQKYAQGKSEKIWNWLFSFTWFLSPFSNITENMFSISARSTSDVRKIEHICRKNKEGKSTMWSNLVWNRIWPTHPNYIRCWSRNQSQIRSWIQHSHYSELNSNLNATWNAISIRIWIRNSI